MRRSIQFVVVILLASCVFGGDAESPQSMHATEIEFAASRGQQIYEVDRASARGTDALLSTIDTAAETRVQGWITVPQRKGHLVRFVGVKGETTYSYYDVSVPTDGHASVQQLDPPRPLSASERAMFEARTSASQAMPFTCSDRYNTIVLPHEAGDKWVVYLLAATTKADEILVGGHFRMTVSKDGGTVDSVDPLAKSCLAIAQPREEDARKAVGVFVTHILSSTPIETHVFLSLLHGVPLYVGTDTGAWLVSGGSIRFMGVLPSNEGAGG